MDALDRDALTTFLVTFVAYGLGRAGLLPQNAVVVAVILLAVVFVFAAAVLWSDNDEVDNPVFEGDFEGLFEPNPRQECIDVSEGAQATNQISLWKFLAP